jgi:putative oxidoreductase
MNPERYAPQLYAVMRIVFGLVFLMYGSQKFGMLGGVDGQGASVPIGSWPFGVAGPIEVVVGICLILGLLTNVVAFIAAGEMAVAYFMNHFPIAPFPVQNMGQPAVLFCFAFLYMAAKGSGIWSVDAARGAATSGRAASV